MIHDRPKYESATSRRQCRAPISDRWRFSSATPYGSGHINDTYCAVFDQSGAPARIILQRINTGIFRNPAALMENIQRVTSHLAAQLDGQADSMRRVLSLIPRVTGAHGTRMPRGVAGAPIASLKAPAPTIR